jgi:hypothetical protein
MLFLYGTAYGFVGADWAAESLHASRVVGVGVAGQLVRVKPRGASGVRTVHLKRPKSTKATHP